ncbi:MAG TPA: Gfo/Idh/MocA family oxidoreductase [Steroidobacteraceae bacterium]|nr:Gfo/Idh/MocA family oxidoreductase [Steroidobacteraceae bacterium]
MQRIRYGMVGGGEGAFIGAVHRMAARLDDAWQLVGGAFSSNADRSQRSGAALGLPPTRCYDHFEQMMEREAALPASERMQCVVIVTPNRTHLPIARAALARGFHVLSDKPATATLAECQQLQTLLRDGGLQYGLTHPYTGYPMIREARARIARGELGTVRKVLVEYLQGWLAAPIEREGNKQATWRLDPAEAGISCCMGDIGVHAFNLAEFVAGRSTQSLCADLHSVVPGRGLDDDGTVLLRFDGGATGVLMASQICTGEENSLRLRIYGDRASIDWQQMEANTLWLKPIDGPVQQLRTGVAGTGGDAAASQRTPAGHPEGYIEAFANLYREFAEQLRTRSHRTVPGISAALRGMAFVDTAVASSAAGNQWRDLPHFD